MLLNLVPKIGLEPTTFRLQGDCTTNCAISAYLADEVGLEPTTR